MIRVSFSSLSNFAKMHKRNRPSSSLSNYGFSITEILVALGLVAIIGAGLAAVMSSAAKQQRGVQAKDQQREISAEIRSLLSKSAACKYSFGGKNPAAPGFSVDAIKDENNVDRYNITIPSLSTDKTGLLKFTAFKVLVSPSDPSNADLTVLLSKVGDVGTVREIRPDNIKLRIKLDGSGLITDCISIGTVTDGFWQIGVPNPNDIYFSAGNVGIGTTNPSYLLDVVGPAATAVRIQGNSQSIGLVLDNLAAGAHKWSLANSGGGPAPAGSLVFYDNSIPPAPGVARMTIDPNGNVGIGLMPLVKLHAAGEVRTETAEAGTALTMRNSSNGNSWRYRTYGNATIDANLFLEYSNGDVNTTPTTPYTNSMSFLRNGNVGIGWAAPRTKLDVNGTISAAMPGTNGSASPLCYNGVTGAIDGCVSLRKFKTNIQPLKSGLSEVLALEPVSYSLKNTHEKEIGFIAEDAINIESRLALMSTSGTLAGMKYDKLTALIVKAIQQFHTLWSDDHEMLTSDHQRLDLLEQENAYLREALCMKDKSLSICHK